ncbi:conserved hypothetical protein [Rippkaea orientalis PCC 8801]|uniref:Uncharacterized protein n=1 Tax=Rippkaea orientalis (strain PCC 8801 / RF-1) TaxID=41431 RepID=B7K2X1_RIPO1|nr:hypothetical protein [Rippkaea orientalis]ACK67672.1 conserved hypothetical protein [Rippkaea orientalis PCC 8801]
MKFPTFSDHPSISLEQNWKRELHYQYPRHMRLQPPSLSRKHPDITLNHSSLSSQVNGPPKTTKDSINQSCPIPLKQPSKVVSNSLTKTHIENIRRNLERRLEIAKTQGNDHLIGLLEQESQYLLTL